MCLLFLLDDNDRSRGVPFSESDLAIGGVLDSTCQRVTRVASVSQKVQRRSSTCGNERNYQWESLKQGASYMVQLQPAINQGWG